MSLDLYILSKKTRTHKGTGIYVRDNGETRELKTIDEVKRYFPDRNLEEIEERVYEDDEVWSGNMTHNLWKMADHVVVDGLTMYNLLWEPGKYGYSVVTIDYITKITKGYFQAVEMKDELEKYNPENGWGSYSVFINFLKSFLKSLVDIFPEIRHGEEFTIRASV